MVNSSKVISKKELVQMAYNASGYKSADYIVVNDRFAALVKLSEVELLNIINNKNDHSGTIRRSNRPA